MDSYNFILFFDGADVTDDEVVGAFFQGRCDDATFGLREGAPYAEFDREAPSFAEAVISAIRDVERAVEGTRVTRVEPDDLVTASVIAERTGRSRESVRLLVAGERGPGDFPTAAAWVNPRTRVWHWGAVSEWFERRLGESTILGGAPQFTAALNGTLQARNQIVLLSEIVERDGAQTLAVPADAVAELTSFLAEGVDELQRELTPA